jgi:hypothetical protein
MATSKSGYDKLLSQSEPIHPSADLRFSVRVVAKEYNTKYTRDAGDRRKFFVVDTDQERILWESDWNIPSDPGTDGQRKRAIAFRTGYKQRLDDEQAAPTAGQPVGSDVTDQVDSADVCNDCGGFQR